MAKGFGGMPGNLQDIMKQAQKMQKEILKAQEEAANITAQGSSGGGMVKVTANGKNQLVSVEVEKEVINPEDPEMLQDLIIAAANEALQKVGEGLKAEMAKVTGGMNLPGLF
jgi:DNA-binding YbaB/EbfC family protein